MLNVDDTFIRMQIIDKSLKSLLKNERCMVQIFNSEYICVVFAVKTQVAHYKY